MKPACLSPDNPTGARNPCLGRCENQLELWPARQLELAIAETWKDIVMNSAEIKKAYSHDLRNLLDSPDTIKYWKNEISKELDIRQIINTSSSDSAANIRGLELRPRRNAIYKLSVLAEALYREEVSRNRETITKKIIAATHRLERKTGLYMLHDPSIECVSPWFPTEDYNPKKHAPKQQHHIDGVIIDPCLPWDFENTPNEDRDPHEVADWWGVAYIRSNYIQQTRHYRYDIYQLDGGAWDRPTFKTAENTLSWAIHAAKTLNHYWNNAA